MKEDYELILFDRLEVIKTTNQKYDLEHNAYLSFSGGKDSTILHYLLDMALPNNRIPRVFVNTGIEYQMIVDFVKDMASKDDRFVILQPSTPIKPMLEKFGYPFKSKQHSHNISIYQHSGLTRAVRVYLGKDKTKTGKTSQLHRCPHILEYNFTKNFNIKCSDLCCQKLKKEPVKKWSNQSKKTITLTGMRSEEGGSRTTLGCIITNKDGSLRKFHPLVKIDDEWEKWFVDKIEKDTNKHTLCKLYYSPYNFKRTGCKGCPFALHLQEELEVLEKLLPNERKQCEVIWKPVYEEYRRINYRLKSKEQLTLFDIDD